jgi:hypothetical protein
MRVYKHVAAISNMCCNLSIRNAFALMYRDTRNIYSSSTVDAQGLLANYVDLAVGQLGGDGAVIGRTEEWGGIQFGGDYVVEKKR